MKLNNARFSNDFSFLSVWQELRLSQQALLRLHLISQGETGCRLTVSDPTGRFLARLNCVRSWRRHGAPDRLQSEDLRLLILPNDGGMLPRTVPPAPRQS